MERAAEPHLIEEAERILRQHCTELSLESISMFRKDGTFLYSSDPTIGQQENVGPLFTVLGEFVYDFVVGVPGTIMIHDDASCLILKPLYSDWGKAEGWYFALGRCFDMGCGSLSEDLRAQAEQHMKGGLSEELKTDDNRARLGMAFDLPQIIGKEFEKNDDTVLTIDGDKGIVVQRYDRSPWGISTRRYGGLPPLLRGLDNLDMFLQTETRGILGPVRDQKPRLNVAFSRSEYLLIIGIPVIVGTTLMMSDFAETRSDRGLVLGIIALLEVVLFAVIIWKRNRGQSSNRGEDVP